MPRKKKDNTNPIQEPASSTADKIQEQINNNAGDRITDIQKNDTESNEDTKNLPAGPEPETNFINMYKPMGNNRFTKIAVPKTDTKKFIKIGFEKTAPKSAEVI